MFTLTLPGDEVFNDLIGEFGTIGDVVLEFEHSLVSVSKWESKYERPFLGKEDKTAEETLDYLRIMCLSDEIPDDFEERITQDHIAEVNTYLNAKMTATWFSDDGSNRPNRDIITAEIIYYWMNALNISMECQYWNLTKLFTLIRVINEKNAPPKKMGRYEQASRQRALNEKRLAEAAERARKQ